MIYLCVITSVLQNDSAFSNCTSLKCSAFHICILNIPFYTHFLVPLYNSSSRQELQKERNSVTVQLDQSSRRLTQLEEEKKSADQSLKRTQGLVDDLKGNAEEMAAAILSFWLHSLVHRLTQACFYFPFLFPGKSEGQAGELKTLQSKLEQQTQAAAQELQNTKKTLSDAENKNERSALFPQLKHNVHCAFLNSISLQWG